MLDKLKEFFSNSKSATGSAAKDNRTSKNWYNDKYDWMLVQRNAIFVVLVASIVTIVFLNFSISYIKSTKSIEPFVIEIEPKTGVPTVIQPLTAVAYTGDEAINRYFVWNYVRLREEYNFSDYKTMMQDVRLFSADNVYSQYRRLVDPGNLQSPYNVYGQYTVRKVELKSLIMQDKNTAQVRLRAVLEGGQSGTADKIVVMKFEYNNLEMSDEKRLINPLGFIVTSYRIDDERL